MEKTVSEVLCRTKEFLSGLCLGWGKTRPRKSVACDFDHRFTCDGHLFDHDS